MPAVAAIICWDGDPRGREWLDRMLAAMGHRAGVCQGARAEPLVVGVGGRAWLGVVRRAPTGAWRAGAEADAQASLDASGPVATAYEGRPGARVSLAFDDARGELRAERDAIGVRPLFWARHGRSVLVASEVGALLAVLPRRRDAETVRRFLLGDGPTARATFYEGIARVPAGHALVARESGAQVSAWWTPREDRVPADAKGLRRELRDRLYAAVEGCVAAARGVVVQTSGGIDSSSIACVADRLQLQGRSPPVAVASAVFPGSEADESRFLDALAERIEAPRVRWDGASIDESDPPEIAHPFRSPLPAIDAGCARVARDRGADVLLSGVGGDQVFFERGVFRDLAAHGRVLSLWRETRLATRYSVQPAAWWRRDAVRALVPAGLVALRRRLRRPAPGESRWPDWLAPALRREQAAQSEESLADAVAWPSHTQRATWQWLRGEDLAWTLEADELCGARYGVEKRYPLLDPAVVQLVMSASWRLRVPHGRMKALLRDAMADDLPHAIAERQQVTTFNAILRDTFTRHLPWVRGVLREGPWASEAYVDRARACALLRRAEDDRSRQLDWDDLRPLWDIACVETWLRAMA